MTDQPDRLTQVKSLLLLMAESLKQQKDASDERMTRLEQTISRVLQESNERLTRIKQLFESNNRFLEGFSQRIDRYTNRMDNLANKLDTFSSRIERVIFTTNQDRQETNSRLASIQRQLQTVENKVDQLLEADDD